MEGQVGCEDIFSLFHLVEIRHQSRAVILYHQEPVDTGRGILLQSRIQNFRKTDCNRFARFRVIRRNRDQRHSRDVFTHVIEICPAALLGFAECCNGRGGADYMHRFIIPCYQPGVGKLFSRLHNRGGRPDRQAEIRFRPSLDRRFLCGIIALSLEEGGKANRAVCAAEPRIRIRNESLRGAVSISEYKLCHERALIAVVVVVQALKGGHTCPPTFAENSTQHILTICKIVRYIVTAVGEDGVILRGTGVEPFVCGDLLPVDIEVVNALRCQIQACFCHFSGSSEHGAKHRCSAKGRICINKHSVFSAAGSDAAAINCKPFQSFKDGIACTGLNIQKRTACKTAAVFNGITAENRALPCSAGEADTVEVRIGVDSCSKRAHHHIAGSGKLCTVDSKGEGAGCTEDIETVNIKLIFTCQQAVQIFISLHNSKRYRGVILSKIPHTIYIDFHTAFSRSVRKVQLDAHIVLPFGKPGVENLVLQAEIVRPEDEGSRVAAFRKLHIGRDMEYGLGCSV